MTRQRQDVPAEDVVKRIRSMARPDRLEGMARYGMTPEGRMGLSIPDLRKMAREVGRSHPLALDLWKTGIQEARILAAMIDRPAEVTEDQMEDWVKDIDSWDVCDQVCMNLFDKTPLARKKIFDWSQREEEYVKRAAFSLIACLAVHDKKAHDDELLAFLPVIEAAASDERNFVKKAVSWALRNLGKRNPVLREAAITTARKMERSDSKAARWVAKDALREFHRKGGIPCS